MNMGTRYFCSVWISVVSAAYIYAKKPLIFSISEQQRIFVFPNPVASVKVNLKPVAAGKDGDEVDDCLGSLFWNRKGICAYNLFQNLDQSLGLFASHNIHLNYIIARLTLAFK